MKQDSRVGNLTNGSGTLLTIIIPALQQSWKGGILVSRRRPSVRPSVRLWTEWCPLCNFHNTSQIHFIFTHLIKQGVPRIIFFCKIPKFEFLANFSNSYYWLCLVLTRDLIWYESIVWVIMGWWEVFSEEGVLVVTSSGTITLTLNAITLRDMGKIDPYKITSKWNKTQTLGTTLGTYSGQLLNT